MISQEFEESRKEEPSKAILLSRELNSQEDLAEVHGRTKKEIRRMEGKNEESLYR